MALKVDVALNKIELYDPKLKVEIIKTKSFKEDFDFDVNDCIVIKQEIVGDSIRLTVAYFNI